MKFLISQFEKHLSFFFHRLFSAKSISQPQSDNILVVKLCCMGDAVISLHILKAYHEKYPKKKIHLLCSKRISEVYSSVPFINKVYVFPISGKNLFWELLKPGFWRSLYINLSQLKSNQYDDLIDMELYRYFPLWIKSLLKIPHSRGFSLDNVQKKPHNILTYRDKNSLEWVDMLMLMDLNKEDLPSPNIIYPHKKTIGTDLPIKVGIVFGSSFNWPQKKWPPEKFIKLCDYLLSKNCEVLLLGASFEKKEGDKIAGATNGPVDNQVGNLNYQQLIEAIQSCQLLIGNDTGPIHLAGACGIPSITIFGPTNPKKWTAFYSNSVFIDLECRPCYYLSHMPACSHRNCLNQLELDLVQKEIEKLKIF